MGQLIIPNEIKIKGPWILSENDLEELDDVLMEIDRLINKSYHIEIEKEIEKKFPELKKWDEKITREEAKETARSQNLGARWPPGRSCHQVACRAGRHAVRGPQPLPRPRGHGAQAGWHQARRR